VVHCPTLYLQYSGVLHRMGALQPVACHFHPQSVREIRTLISYLTLGFSRAGEQRQLYQQVLEQKEAAAKSYDFFYMNESF